VPRVTVLFNTHAGTLNSESAELVADAFHSANCDADIRPTHADAIASAARHAVDDGAGIVVAAGGDGTVSAAAAAVAGTRSALGVLPFGTLNHFAKDLHIPLDLSDAVKTIAVGRTTDVDVGELNGRPFINNSSVGMYAAVVAERAVMQRAARTKWLAQGLAVLRVWRRYQRMRVVMRALSMASIVSGRPRPVPGADEICA